MAGNCLLENRVLSVLRSHYDITPLSILRSSGYDCSNFEISVGNPDERVKTKYFVKTIQGWHFAERIRMQHTVLEYLALRGFVASRPLKTKDGRSVVKFILAERRYLLQLLTYLEGSPLNSAIQNTDELLELGFGVGKKLASLHLALKDCVWDRSILNLDPSGIESAWKCGEGFFVEEYLTVIDNLRVKSLLQKHLEESKRRLLLKLPELRMGTVHGDFTDTNILLKSAPGCERSWEISGIIDFEDACHGYLSGDLGVCVAYFMMKSISLPNSNLAGVTREIIRGYHSMNPLNDSEKETLFDFAIERLAVSYLVGQVKLRRTPGNAGVILMQSKHIPAVLEHIETLGRSAILNEWFKNTGN